MRCRVLLKLVFAGLCLPLMAQAPPDECLVFVSSNLARGNGNWYSYVQFSSKRLHVREGDVLEYEVLLDPANPEPKGGIDVGFEDEPPLRELGILDQEGLRSHGDAPLEPAKGAWYLRKIPLTKAAGRVIASWNVVFEGDREGRYAQFIDNVRISHSDGSKTPIYITGSPATRAVSLNNGYTFYPALLSVERDRLPGAIREVVASAEERSKRLRELDDVRRDVDLAREFARRNPDSHLQQHIEQATALLQQAERSPEVNPEQVQKALNAAKNALSHTHPVMERYTGHLVGHAHIDLQWLWEWQEGIIVSHDTFAQALKFMDEFPGFTFSQSSSCLYQAIEQNYPDLFKKIQQKVRKGQWELVGGRVCEGDTNMISPESHARHFLYGQRYFREKFGKTAVVGWEPDTFGHTAQMPQILKLGGCDYYYFCRAGKGKPLFWWQGLDGTRVLTFEEPATGSWYNADLSYKQFEEMLGFQDRTGSKDMLWVYGVGNHGGGPTREHIQEALKWMKDPSKPKVRFSTATEFFKKLSSHDLSKIPVIDQDLNPVFEGCYTTHAEIKQLNRAAEYSTSTAEAAASVASLFGFDYPASAFRRSWEEITFNHHHDTLPGSGVHSPYERTKTQLNRVLADNRDVVTRALETLSIRQTPYMGGISMLVFNPTGWKRSGWVETYALKSGWDGGEGLDFSRLIAIGPDDSRNSVEVLDPRTRRIRFWAGDVPAFGYRVFHIRNDQGGEVAPDREVGIDRLENTMLLVEFDREKGVIRRLFDKQANQEVVPPGGSMGRIETHFEEPVGMSAWTLGKIAKVEAMPSTGNSGFTFTYQIPATNNPGKTTTVRQTFRLEPGMKQVDVTLECDWQHIGTGQSLNPLLRVAFDGALTNPVATYDVPFGALARPTDGAEVPALNWADMSDASYGFSILNDSKHGLSASGSTLRMSLIRSSYEPDPVPNPGSHTWRYAIVPHKGDWQTAGIVKRSIEFLQPMLPVTVPFEAKGDAPKEWSFGAFSDFNVVPTSLKRAEEGEGFILRAYESAGRSSRGRLEAHVSFRRAQWVNFIEDSLGSAESSDGVVPLNLRPFEIRSIKLIR